MSVVVKREQCATCRYFKEAVEGSGEILDIVGGWCMRYPPVVQMVGGEDRTLFPVIYTGSAQKVWCGEWEDAS
jgi:hypothetical protein